MVNYILSRIVTKDNHTIGVLTREGGEPLFTLEDGHRDEKVAGETRIPKGRYKLSFLEELTPLTSNYRTRFDWFSWHIQLEDVEGFSNIYLHIGNFVQDTDGCILVGQTCDLSKKDGFIGDSIKAYKKFYKEVQDYLNAGEDVYLTIVDNGLKTKNCGKC